jgi:hypothetical protein
MERNCSSIDADVSKRNLEKIKGARESGKIKKLESEFSSCAVRVSQSKNPPVPVWFPKKTPTRITVRDLPDIPTSKIIGSFDSSSEIRIDGGKP